MGGILRDYSYFAAGIFTNLASKLERHRAFWGNIFSELSRRCYRFAIILGRVSLNVIESNP